MLAGFQIRHERRQLAFCDARFCYLTGEIDLSENRKFIATHFYTNTLEPLC